MLLLVLQQKIRICN